MLSYVLMNALESDRLFTYFNLVRKCIMSFIFLTKKI